MGVANGCGCKEVLLLYLFFVAVASLLFVHFFRSCDNYMYNHLISVCQPVTLQISSL